MRFCLLCSDKTFEKKSIDGKKKLVSANNQFDREGLRCSQCQRFACKECVTSFVKKAGKHGKNDHWCSVVKQYLIDDKQPEQFMGHCCELGRDADKDQLLKCPKISSGDTRYDGYLHLPDFGVLISSDFDCSDVHGLIECAEPKKSAKIKDYPKKKKYLTHFGPLAHCVIGQEASQRYYNNNVIATGSHGEDLGIFSVNVGSVDDCNKKQKVRTDFYS